MGKALRSIVQWVIQWTWGLPQNLAGLAVLIAHRRCKRCLHGDALVCDWPNSSGMSLGMFVFVPDQLEGEAREQLIAHEKGHTLQSLMLGPLYLPVIGVTSAAWSNSKRAENYRKRTGRDYYAVFPENWANRLGGV